MFWSLFAKVNLPPTTLIKDCCSATAPRLGVSQEPTVMLPERSSRTPSPPRSPPIPTSARNVVFKAAAALSTRT